jgi:hypothetical protein
MIPMIANDLKNEQLLISLEDDLKKEMLTFFSDEMWTYFNMREGVGLVFSFWRDRHPELLASISDERLGEIWRSVRVGEEACPFDAAYLSEQCLIPCDGIDTLLSKHPVISRGLFRFQYGQTPFAQRGGIEFSESGWLPILEDAFGWLENEAVLRKEAGFPDSHIPRLSQVKEKFGRLRISCSVPASCMGAWREKIGEAEEQSGKMCMRCGLPATLRANGWLHAYCDACEKAYLREQANGR